MSSIAAFFIGLLVFVALIIATYILARWIRTKSEMININRKFVAAVIPAAIAIFHVLSADR